MQNMLQDIPLFDGCLDASMEHSNNIIERIIIYLAREHFYFVSALLGYNNKSVPQIDN